MPCRKLCGPLDVQLTKNKSHSIIIRRPKAPRNYGGGDHSWKQQPTGQVGCPQPKGPPSWLWASSHVHASPHTQLHLLHGGPQSHVQNTHSQDTGHLCAAPSGHPPNAEDWHRHRRAGKQSTLQRVLAQELPEEPKRSWQHAASPSKHPPAMVKLVYPESVAVLPGALHPTDLSVPVVIFIWSTHDKCILHWPHSRPSQHL